MTNSTQIHTVYRKANGDRVPSVTTCLGILGKPAIIHWAWECGVAGSDYRKVRDQSGDIGSLVHYLILCQLRQAEPDLANYTQNNIVATVAPMSKFKAWLKEHTVEPILLETPLVSELHSFGGTPDYYGKIDGQLCLADFKTGKDVYPDMFCQLAAYKELLIENGHPVETARIIRLGKSKDEGFEDRATGNLENQWKVFLACKQIYELQKVIRQDKAAE